MKGTKLAMLIMVSVIINTAGAISDSELINIVQDAAEQIGYDAVYPLVSHNYGTGISYMVVYHRADVGSTTPAVRQSIAETLADLGWQIQEDVYDGQLDAVAASVWEGEWDEEWDSLGFACRGSQAVCSAIEGWLKGSQPKP